MTEFKKGEMILVTDSWEGGWVEREFVFYDFGEMYPYVCRYYQNSVDYQGWKYAKKKEEWIDIDGTKWSKNTIKEALRKHAE